MAVWTVGIDGELYVHGVKVPGVKSVDVVPSGRKEIRYADQNGQIMSRPGEIIPGELIIRVSCLSTDSNLEIHPDLRDQVVDELMARILKLEDEQKRLRKNNVRHAVILDEALSAIRQHSEVCNADFELLNSYNSVREKIIAEVIVDNDF